MFTEQFRLSALKANSVQLFVEVAECKPVRPEGFEPPTLGSEDRCSIQLSYGRIEHSVPTDVSLRDGLAQSFKTDSVRHHFWC